ncbi:hypothetical protein EBZ80_14675 [bacterium]|nr:hypothetical protein [bacterium]
MFRRLSIATLFLGLALANCARPPARDASADNGRVFVGMSVASQDALPPCDRPMAGRIVYVATDKAFLACGDSGQWRTDKSGTAAAWQKAFTVYRKLRAGIIRIATQCEDRGGSKSSHVGSGFHCAQGVVCTDRHVLDCPDGSALVRINLHRVSGDAGGGPGDTGDSDVEMPPPFYSMTETSLAESQITHHPTQDLAKIKLASADPAVLAMPVLGWKDSPVNPGVLGHAYILSMSYPLGFTAPYAQIGSMDNGRMYEFSTSHDLDSGSNGSPVLDLDGRVIGVIVRLPATEPARSGLATGPVTWAIDASLLSAF